MATFTVLPERVAMNCSLRKVNEALLDERAESVEEPAKVELPPHCPATAPEKDTERPLCVTVTVPVRQQQVDWSQPLCTAYEPAHVTSPGAGAAVVAGGGDVGGEVGALVDDATFKSKSYASWHETTELSHSMTR